MNNAIVYNDNLKGSISPSVKKLIEDWRILLENAKEVPNEFTFYPGEIIKNPKKIIKKGELSEEDVSLYFDDYPTISYKHIGPGFRLESLSEIYVCH